jgi:hypothetical protein
VLVDEMTVFDRRLTTLEVEKLAGAEAPLTAALADSGRVEDLRDYYVSTTAPGRPALFRSLMALRGEENALLTAAPEVMAMEERTEERPTYILNRGAYDAPTRRVEPGTPAAVLPFPDDQQPDRLGLARWLFAPENPLAARVAVNRYWQLIFGRGLVATPEDFGSQGALPSHPLLLDRLATEFRERDWDLKALLKEMVMSATYRQSSVATAERRAEATRADTSKAEAPKPAPQPCRSRKVAASVAVSARARNPRRTPARRWDCGSAACRCRRC